MSQITAIIGHYGSGKTEVAMNLAAREAKRGRATLVDMDIVNPYFRSAEHALEMEAAGVKLVSPTYAATSVDIPALPPTIDAAIIDCGARVILDVGGDDAGARALGRYKPALEARGLALLAVINPYRPRSATVELILEALAAMSRSARFPITGLINNANLGSETRAEQILYGREILREVTRLTGIPCVMEAGLPEALADVPKDNIDRLNIIRYTRPEWMD